MSKSTRLPSLWPHIAYLMAVLAITSMVIWSMQGMKSESDGNSDGRQMQTAISLLETIAAPTLVPTETPTVTPTMPPTIAPSSIAYPSGYPTATPTPPFGVDGRPNQ